ncbi:MAG: glycerol-3-phosphate dehydrogenase, partial [Leptospira sp.]|nr:glycerol-3-phosphate dehydrogenase [Leptospira sp.]
NADTKNISREEMILVSPSGLITMSGGKWSTYRKMAEDLTDRVIKEGELNPANKCSTYNYPFIGATGFSEKLWIEIQKIYSVNEETAKRLQDYYGTEVFDVLGKCPSEITSQKDYYKEEVLFAIRNEFALSVLDILARRFRVLFTNLKLAKRLVKPIAEIMQMELGWDQKQTKESENEADNLIKDLQESIL